MHSSKVTVSNPNVQVTALEENTVIVIGQSGPQGAAGGMQVVAYVFTQNLPLDTWTIVHGLDFVPSITVVDSAGSVVEGDYSYPNENTIIATFFGAFAGKAYLS